MLAGNKLNRNLIMDSLKQERKLRIGQNFMVRNYRESIKWMTGIILQNCGPLSYLVKSEGQIWHRHIDHIQDNQLENTSSEYFMLVNRDNKRIPNANTGQESTDIQPPATNLSYNVPSRHYPQCDVMVNFQTVISNRLLNDCLHVFVVSIIYLHLYLKCGGISVLNMHNVVVM